MRVFLLIAVLLAAVGVSLALYRLSGGHLIVFALPLVLAGPVALRRRRG